MNRKLIVKMLGALLLIEAAAMVPALIIAFISSFISVTSSLIIVRLGLAYSFLINFNSLIL